MNIKEIAELGMYVAGAGIIGFAANELRKKYVNWAEKNKFYDISPRFSDLENRTYNAGDVVEFEGDKCSLNFIKLVNKILPIRDYKSYYEAVHKARKSKLKDKFYNGAIKLNDLADKTKNTGKTVRF